MALLRACVSFEITLHCPFVVELAKEPSESVMDIFLADCSAATIASLKRSQAEAESRVARLLFHASALALMRSNPWSWG